jgi:O-succinylbenzoate synthase
METHQQKGGQHIRYSSLKVKVGHQDAALDAVSVAASLQQTSKLRPDANQAWTESDALNFSTALHELDLDMGNRIEFVEEPIQKVSGNWTLSPTTRIVGEVVPTFWNSIWTGREHL